MSFIIPANIYGNNNYYNWGLILFFKLSTLSLPTLG